MQTNTVLRNALKSRLVRFNGPHEASYLTDWYPEFLETKSAFGETVLPNPDLGPFILEHRRRHVEYWESRCDPQTITDLATKLFLKKPSPERGTVVLLAAGPSLGDHILDVKNYHQHATVVALNRALMAYPMPDVFFCLERQAKDEWWKGDGNSHWWGGVPSGVPTITCPSCHSDLLKHFNPNMIHYCISPWCAWDQWPDAPEWALGLPHIPTCEITIASALAFCANLNPARIVLVGADHAFKVNCTDDNNHGSPGEYYCDGEIWKHQGKIAFGGEVGINGRLCATTYTTRRQSDVTKACCEQIERMQDTEVINASGHGILFHNVQNGFFFGEIQKRKLAEREARKIALESRFDTTVQDGKETPHGRDEVQRTQTEQQITTLSEGIRILRAKEAAQRAFTPKRGQPTDSEGVGRTEPGGPGATEEVPHVPENASEPGQGASTPAGSG